MQYPIPMMVAHTGDKHIAPKSKDGRLVLKMGDTLRIILENKFFTFKKLQYYYFLQKKNIDSPKMIYLISTLVHKMRFWNNRHHVLHCTLKTEILENQIIHK